MGLSKRNPRGNFNWQSRILKKKAQNCGQIPLLNCDEISPRIGISTNFFCVSDPPISYILTVADITPGDHDVYFKIYKDNVLVDQGFGNFLNAYDYVINPLTSSAEGTYKVEATNPVGCSSVFEKYIPAYDKPSFTYSTVGSSVPCTFNPPGVDPPTVGDGSITITVTNPMPGVQYYYRLYWDSAVAIYYEETQGTFTSYTFENLCNIRYFVYVGVVIPGYDPLSCNSSQEVNLA